MDLVNIINYRTKIIYGIIFLCAIFVSYKIYVAQRMVISSLNQSREMEMKKNALFSDIIKLEKKMGALKTFVNTKDISTIIKRVGAIANDSKVKINAIKPMDKREFDIYFQHQFSLSINAESYNDFGVFMKNLENSPDVYRVDEATIQNSQDKSSASEKITVDLVISTFILK